MASADFLGRIPVSLLRLRHNIVAKEQLKDNRPPFMQSSGRLPGGLRNNKPPYGLLEPGLL